MNSQTLFRVLCATSVVSLTVVLSAGCGETTFTDYPDGGRHGSEVEITSVQSTGLLGVTCAETAFEQDYRIRFTATTNYAQPIEPAGGEESSRIPEVSVSSLSVVDDTAILFPTPDVPCVTSADCDAAGLNTLSADGQRFECVSLGTSAIEDEGSPVCGKQIGLSVNGEEAVAFIPMLPADDDALRKTIFLLSNSYQMHNFNPFSDGHEFVQGLSPDEGNWRRSALAVAFSEVTNQQGRFEDSVDAEVGVFTNEVFYSALARSGETDFAFFRLRDRDESSPTPFDSALGDVDRFIFDAVSGRNDTNHFAALRNAIRQLSVQPEGVERSIVLLTDGDVARALRPDAANSGDTYATVREEALAADVAIHIVHLDNGTQGRVGIGGLDNLAQLACLTGGSFRYVQQGTDLLDAYRAIGEGLPASYEAVLSADGIGQVPSGVYTVGFVFTVTANGKTVTLPFEGNTVRGNERVDTRAAIRLAVPCSSDADCLLDRVCNTGTSMCEAGSDYPACPAGETLTANGCQGGQ